ncbi:MAG: hypothetical protein WBN83_18340 [Desulfoprunum sp.]|jgi:hypothetical protein|uniref:hypothetical protein n=1 Tax=Desulfoprunum sp. TaxID=2020866 RepID=UPI000AD706B9
MIRGPEFPEDIRATVLHVALAEGRYFRTGSRGDCLVFRCMTDVVPGSGYDEVVVGR